MLGIKVSSENLEKTERAHYQLTWHTVADFLFIKLLRLGVKKETLIEEKVINTMVIV